MLYKKGDIVRVYFLQSFSYGGFINGREGVVKQYQRIGGSVHVSIERIIDGEYRIDPNYEVYPEQLRLVKGGKVNKKVNKKNNCINNRFDILDL